ncbi:MAG TPA: MoxR family ATPase [bacterium]|nr:MoxR family ATPase [bacterium]
MMGNINHEFDPDRVSGLINTVNKEISKVIVGQSEVVEQALVGLFSKGHILLVGVPGLAKTLLVRTLAGILGLEFNRIQFTPDLMPADITGTEILQNSPDGGKCFSFIKGPVFSNVILADEINRTPPKTQAALLQAMQEYSITVGAKTYSLDKPFFVLATQNPIEQEGTYPLPEAQLDRFMLNVKVDYPDADEEAEIVSRTTAIDEPEVSVVLSKEDLLSMQELARQIPVADHVVKYSVSLVRSTRPWEKDIPEFINKWVSWGAGPRASQYLVLGAKTRALIKGKNAATIEDIRAVAKPVLRHRIIPNFSAEADGVIPDLIIDKLIEEVKAPSGKLKD